MSYIKTELIFTAETKKEKGRGKMKERKKTVSFVMFAENYTEHFIFPGILERLMSRWEKTVLKRTRLKAIPREELSPIRWNSIRKISTE